ncbi:hypothetical protein PAEPH01_0367 [Pancytospora epiphaga]|nr:hypothetical protein PAEPH01_0367 [Pancytospora epiphaga]
MNTLFAHLLWLGISFAKKEEASANPNLKAGLTASHTEGKDGKSMLADSPSSDSSTENGDDTEVVCMKCNPFGTVPPKDVCEETRAAAEKKKECAAKAKEKIREKETGCCEAQKNACTSCDINSADNTNEDQGPVQRNPSRYIDVRKPSSGTQ